MGGTGERKKQVKEIIFTAKGSLCTSTPVKAIPLQITFEKNGNIFMHLYYTVYGVCNVGLFHVSTDFKQRKGENCFHVLLLMFPQTVHQFGGKRVYLFT